MVTAKPIAKLCRGPRSTTATINAAKTEIIVMPETTASQKSLAYASDTIAKAISATRDSIPRIDSRNMRAIPLLGSRLLDPASEECYSVRMITQRDLTVPTLGERGHSSPLPMSTAPNDGVGDFVSDDMR